MASRMESTGIPGKIQVSRQTYERVHDLFEFEEREGVEVKGKGTVSTYIVVFDVEAHTKIQATTHNNNLDNEDNLPENDFNEEYLGPEDLKETDSDVQEHLLNN